MARSGKLLAIILAQVGIGKHFWINIVLTILGYLPGVIHAIWVIWTFPRS